MFIIAGLGNPGEEYENTRHNTGRIMLDGFRKAHDFPEWEKSAKYKALISEGKIKKEKVMLIDPETFMNKSGGSLGGLVTSAKKAESLVVIHDELDIPFGKFKISFNKSSGGHRGVESIIKAVKTEGFVRVRVGISPSTPSGKLKKPTGDEAVSNFILGKFRSGDEATLKKVSKKVSEALLVIVTEGREKAMGMFNKSN